MNFDLKNKTASIVHKFVDKSVINEIHPVIAMTIVVTSCVNTIVLMLLVFAVYRRWFCKKDRDDTFIQPRIIYRSRGLSTEVPSILPDELELAQVSDQFESGEDASVGSMFAESSTAVVMPRSVKICFNII